MKGRMLKAVIQASESQLVVSAVWQVVQCCDDISSLLSDAWPGCGAQNQYPDLSFRKVLLISQVLVGSDEYMVAVSFRCAEKVSILQCRPLAFIRGVHIMWM